MTAIDFQAILRNARNKNQKSVRAAQPGEGAEAATPSLPRWRSLLPDFSFFLQPSSVSSYKVTLVESIHYIPNFLTPSEEESVVHNIDAKEQFATINGKSELLSDTAATKWRSLTRRRLKMFGGVPVAYGGGMMPTPCPDWVMELFGIMEKIKRDLGREDKFNHVLLNQYNDGMGIGAHKDGPLYEDIVFVLNLGGPAAIKFFENEKDKDSRSWSVFLEERSLLIFSGDAYNNFYHEIEDTQEDVIDSTFLNIPLTRVNIGDVIKRNPRRLSLTVRTVKLVSSVDSLMETPEQKAEMIRREQAFYQSISEKV